MLGEQAGRPPRFATLVGVAMVLALVNPNVAIFFSGLGMVLLVFGVLFTVRGVLQVLG